MEHHSKVYVYATVASETSCRELSMSHSRSIPFRNFDFSDGTSFFPSAHSVPSKEEIQNPHYEHLTRNHDRYFTTNDQP